MTLVADASVLVAALVDSGHEGEWAEPGIAAGHVAGPELVLAEATNTLRLLEHAGGISGLDAVTPDLQRRRASREAGHGAITARPPGLFPST